MKTYEYVPTHDRFKGKIELEIPTYKERLALVKEVGIMDEKTAMDNLDKMFEVVEKRVKKVEIELDTQKINSLDELSYYQQGALIINELGQILIQGIPLGEK